MGRAANAVVPFLRHRTSKRGTLPILPLLPAATLAMVFLILPGILVALISVRPGTSFGLGEFLTGTISFEHYQRVVGSPGFLKSVWITFIYVAGVVAVSALIGLHVAVVLQKAFRGRNSVRVLMLMPWAVPGVVVSILFLWMFNQGFGVVNGVLTRVGLIQDRIGWLNDVRYALVGVMIPTIWKTYPFVAITLIASMKSIPSSLYEAAKIDGAGELQQFRYVTLPAIAPALILAVIVTSLLSFKEFDFIYPLTGGGPAGATETLAIRIYNEAFQYFRLERASALGVITTAIAAVIALLGYRSLRREYFR